MMSEMPLPMPRSEICSPTHMMKAVPVVSVRTVIRRKNQPGCGTTPPCCRKNASSAWKLIPGTGIWPPTRYTASIRNVKTTRFLRSGMLKMFLIDSNMLSPLRARRHGDRLGPAAGPGDLVQGRLAEAVRLHDDRPGQLAVAEHLDA